MPWPAGPADRPPTAADPRRGLDELVPRRLSERWGFRAVHYAP